MNVAVANAAPSVALVLPRQHGAWATLAASFVLGSWAIEAPSAESLLLAAVLVAAFVGRHAIGRAARLPASHPARAAAWRWAALLTGAAIIGGSVLAGPLGHRALLPLGIVAACIVFLSIGIEARRKDRTLAGEAVNMMGLSLAAPAAVALKGGAGPATTIAVGALAIAFFVPAIFRVRCRARGWKSPSPARRHPALATRSIVAHLAGLLLAAAASITGALPASTLVALGPVTAHAIVTAVRRPPRPTSLRRIGLEELAHTMVFVGLAVATLRA